MTKFGSKNADTAYAVLSDGLAHTSHEFNDRVGWDWRKAVSMVKKYGERTGQFVLHSEAWMVGKNHVKRYWIVRRGTGILDELAALKAKHPAMKATTGTQTKML